MTKLYDISFITFGFLAKDIVLQKTCMYVADLYQNNLNGYKPPKTTRIGLFLGKEKKWNGRPYRNGSITHLSGIFDEDKYRTLDEKNAMRYLLNILHWTIIEHCEELHWDTKVFKNAYDQVIDNDFKFIKSFDEKLSRNKQNHGQVVLKKTVDNTNVHFILNGKDIKVYSNENRYWLDPWYNLSSSSKWFDSDRFGVHFDSGQFKFFYSVNKKALGYELDPKKKSKIELEEKFKRIIEHVNASY